MRHSRAVVAVCGAAALAAAGLAAAPAGASSSSAKVAHTGQDESYVVLAKSAADTEAVAARLRDPGREGHLGRQGDRRGRREHRRRELPQERRRSLGRRRAWRQTRVIGKAPANHVDKVEQEHVTAAKAGRASTTRKNAAKVQGTRRRPARRQPVGHADDQGRPGPHPHAGQPQGQGRDHRHRRPGGPPGHPPELRLPGIAQLREGHRPTSTGRARSRAAPTRSAPTTAGTARTSPASSRRP